MSVTIFWNVIFFLLVCAWIQVFTGQDTKEDEMYVTWWTRTLWCGLTTVCVQLNAVPRGFLTCKIRTCKANRLQMSDVLLSSLCFLYGDVGQHRHRVYWHQCGGEAQEGDEQALLPKEVKILQCVRQNDESWYPPPCGGEDVTVTVLFHDGYWTYWTYWTGSRAPFQTDRFSFAASNTETGNLHASCCHLL